MWRQKSQTAARKAVGKGSEAGRAPSGWSGLLPSATLWPDPKGPSSPLGTRLQQERQIPASHHCCIPRGVLRSIAACRERAAETRRRQPLLSGACCRRTASSPENDWGAQRSLLSALPSLAWGIRRSQPSLALAERSWDDPCEEEDLATLQSSVKERAEAGLRSTGSCKCAETGS